MRTILLVACVLVLAGCSSASRFERMASEPLASYERDSLFATIDTATRASYGYTAQDPVRLGHFGTFKGLQASYEMISRLRLEGQPLKILRRGSSRLEAPFDTTEVKPGSDVRMSGVAFVDRYTLVTPDARDTVHLYFDAYYAAPVRIPQGLELAAPSVNR